MLTAAMLFLLSISLAHSQEKPFDAKDIDQVIGRFKEKWNVPGISVAIAKDGRLIYAKGFGYADTATKEEVTPYSMFRIASCSKTITATGIMKLIQDKRLGINDTVFGPRGILNNSEYVFTDARIGKITVKNLLQQTIGWNKKDVVGGNEASYALKTPTPATPNDVIRYNLQRGLDFAPNSAYLYCNFNYMVLGEVIRKVTGQRYEEFITQEVLNPIGASYTKPGNTFPTERLKHEVHYYESIPDSCGSIIDTTQKVTLSYGGYDLPTMHPSGGWVSRPIDLIKILMGIEGNGSSASILSKETASLMRTPPDTIKSGYAMGLEVSKGAWYHSGALTWGTSSLMCRTAQGVYYAIVCNTLATKPGTDEEQFKTMVEYVIEMHKLLADPLKGVTSYPTTDLFEKYDAEPRALN